ncbi:hypothetical protein Bca4012_089455 [Brassica carinata]
MNYVACPRCVFICASPLSFHSSNTMMKLTIITMFTLTNEVDQPLICYRNCDVSVAMRAMNVVREVGVIRHH